MSTSTAHHIHTIEHAVCYCSAWHNRNFVAVIVVGRTGITGTLKEVQERFFNSFII